MVYDTLPKMGLSDFDYDPFFVLSVLRTWRKNDAPPDKQSVLVNSLIEC